MKSKLHVRVRYVVLAVALLGGSACSDDLICPSGPLPANGLRLEFSRPLAPGSTVKLVALRGPVPGEIDCDVEDCSRGLFFPSFVPESLSVRVQEPGRDEVQEFFRPSYEVTENCGELSHYTELLMVLP